MSDRLLVLVRHGESEWNKKNLFTGWRDVGLTEKGIAEARAAGRKLKAQGLALRYRLHLGARARPALARSDARGDGAAGHSGRSRTRRSTSATTATSPASTRTTPAQKWGAEQVHVWRRSYDVAPPGGESLKDTAARVLPYYIQEILPRVLRGDNVLVSAHGNSLRALVMVLERLSPEQIVAREIATGVPLIYRLNADSTVAEKRDLAA